MLAINYPRMLYFQTAIAKRIRHRLLHALSSSVWEDEPSVKSKLKALEKIYPEYPTTLLGSLISVSILMVVFHFDIVKSTQTCLGADTYFNGSKK